MHPTVKPIWITPNAERTIIWCARVSNPNNQGNLETAPRLLRYLISHNHWSPFEMASACLEIETTRDVARQLLRHRSFSFQEFSQRYSTPEILRERAGRYRAETNRQSSSHPLDGPDLDWWEGTVKGVAEAAQQAYDAALSLGIAKECARALLPEGLTISRLYMVGTIRSWVHFVQVRDQPDAQLETREIAKEARKVLAGYLPNVFGEESAS